MERNDVPRLDEAKAAEARMTRKGWDSRDLSRQPRKGMQCRNTAAHGTTWQEKAPRLPSEGPGVPRGVSWQKGAGPHKIQRGITASGIPFETRRGGAVFAVTLLPSRRANIRRKNMEHKPAFKTLKQLLDAKVEKYCYVKGTYRHDVVCRFDGRPFALINLVGVLEPWHNCEAYETATGNIKFVPHGGDGTASRIIFETEDE